MTCPLAITMLTFSGIVARTISKQTKNVGVSCDSDLVTATTRTRTAVPEPLRDICNYLESGESLTRLRTQVIMDIWPDPKLHDRK
ncbi:unnamed protein product [Angiostrongylus costaricensis]|uniref:Secreted protein n=1 Tax=Angiostrongylus costaricensis TaxID=334426 RepID=A0A0R3PLP5_ANGCS|nr:unnamed protein product [Angiostrongylus costaricensis]